MLVPVAGVAVDRWVGVRRRLRRVVILLGGPAVAVSVGRDRVRLRVALAVRAWRKR